uniref:Retrotransposon gag domain-containing protein n=1 Tax=Oryzias latipes TaxID=8090 RepID=A0A3P9LXV7_ORYLA
PLTPQPLQRTGHTPDPADPEDLRQTVSQQGIFLELLYSAISRITSVQEDLISRIKNTTQTIAKLTELQDRSAPVPTAISGNNATSASTLIPENVRQQPEPFFGDVSACGGFLLQCDLIFQQAPRYYQADLARISLIVNSLRSKALQWAQAFLAAHPITHLPFERFLGEFRLVFDQPRKQEEATRRLLSLKQGNRPVSEHLIDFRILAVEAGCFAHAVSSSLQPAPRLVLVQASLPPLFPLKEIPVQDSSSLLTLTLPGRKLCQVLV